MSKRRISADAYDPGPDFWDVFVRRYWGRRPTVIKQPFGRAIVSPAELFAAMVAAKHRLDGDDRDFALTIDGVRAGADVDRWMPTRKDRSLAGLAQRIGHDLPGSTFALFAPAFQVELGWDVWTRVRRFLTGLYAGAGVPAHRAEIDLFAGTYARTRRGIHLDSADVFCFVIEGRKRIRLWPGSAFRDAAFWYGYGGDDRKLSRSRCLDGEPGDIIYWPSSYWHVGESLGGLVSSLSLGLYQRDSLSTTAARLIEDEVTRELGAGNFVEALPSSAAKLGGLSPRARRAFARASRNLTTTLLRHRMEHVTGYGFAQLPSPPANGRLHASHTIAADPAFPIFYRSVGATAIVAANGRSIALPRSRALQRMIDTLNRGDGVSSKPAGAEAEALRKTLRFLAVSGAVETRRE